MGFLVREVKRVEIPFEAGIVSDNTSIGSKGRYYDMDKMRFRGGKWQTVGGWSAFNASGVAAGTARGAHAWTTLDGERVFATATESAVYAWIAGTRYTITPRWYDGFLNWAFETTSGSTTVRVWHRPYIPATGVTSAPTPHVIPNGSSVTFLGVKNTVGGLDMNGTWTITSVDSLSFTFTHSGSASSTEDETTITTAGEDATSNQFVMTVAYVSGLATGTGNTAATRTRIYSMDNFGENLVFCGSDGTPIFAWQPETAYNELITNGTFGSSTGWALGTGWAVTGGEAVKTAGTASNLSQTVAGILEGGRTYEMTVTTSSFTSGNIGFKIDTTIIYPTILGTADDPTHALTFRFVCPANPTDLIFAADTNCNVNLDNVSIKLLSTAFPIYTAPQKNYALFVDGNRVLNAVGSVEEDGDFNATLLRWCDQDNYYEWNADTDNVAGEYPLGKGSYGVGGCVAGERNLIFTDDSVFSSYFNGTGYSIQSLAHGCGLIGRNAVAVYNGKAFWLSWSGFYMYDGQQVLSIECPIKDEIIGQFKQYQENKSWTWANTEFGEVWFSYAHTDDGSEISRYVGFNILEKGNPWIKGTWDRTCGVRMGTFDHPVCVDASDNVWYHEYGNVFTSATQLPFIETAYFNTSDGDKWMGARRYLPDIKDQVGTLNFTITAKQDPQGQLDTETRGPFTVIPNQKRVDFRIRGRQLKLKWEFVDTTCYGRIGTIPMEILLEQERR